LASLLNHVAETNANVIEVTHQRAMWLAPLGRVGIELVLEVRDEQHGREVHRHLENRAITSNAKASAIGKSNSSEK
jgi:threonine dehydratase